MYKCKNTSEEGVCQSRVYVNLDYIFRVHKLILIAYINAKNPSKERVCQSRVYVKLDYIFRVYECINVKTLVKKVYVSLECMST